MDKNSFIKRVDFNDESIISNIYNKIKLAKKTGIDVYTNEFYTPNIWNKIENMQSELGINVYSYGIFEDAERRMLLFSFYEDIKSYPLDLLRIQLNSKFSKPCHRDFLGALMSLGIKRQKFGDLILKKNEECYLACSSDISEYVTSNFTSVGKANCSLDILDLGISKIPNYNFNTLSLNVSSMRIDCIVSSLCNISRSKGEALVKKGKVQVDYFETLRKDKIIEDTSTVIVQGYGKFKLAGKIGNTGKGRIKLLIKKFS
ncbi:RNA-binding protein [Clostridium tyrobutyricum]|uniref:YlmH family RNA-binding protein n=1 Tax=Clostridium tyrobutyricum TaxID=1519 RepID=UPI001C37F92B|nr:YlmH/Sll1252 family protein [Clostridium tyrobutyricum]MBV4415242.1 RNA-binding protein [Clostridium tyrobutyricum]MBV4420913.1 RNA-binding protein [Clostridium tyrobutyricum]